MEAYVFLVLLCATFAFGLEDFFNGHYEGYGIPPPSEEEMTTDKARAVSTAYFSQIVDHYDPTNFNRWQQRYFVNTGFYNDSQGTAAFLFIGAEGQASTGWMTGGAWIESARMYGALLFQLEHRFYGQSHPFTSLTLQNLRFLSSQQALEDVATFINAMNLEYNLPNDVQWIVFGGSYSASLATWARQKYPHLIQGAVAASGPLFAKLDFYEYREVVVDALSTHSQQCVDAAKQAFVQLEYFINNPAEENLTALFNLCLDINDSANRIDENIAYLFERLSSMIAGVVQYSGIIQQPTIETMCGIFTDAALGREIDRLAEVYKWRSGTTCLNYRYQALITTLARTTIAATSNSRQWYYQTCTEYGWFQTSGQTVPPFGNRNPADFYSGICATVFGTAFNATYITEQNERINRYYGGFDVDVTNVVHVHGSLDPWYPMGITKTVNPESPALFIYGISHCASMYPIAATDPPQLTQARAEINRLIGLWLGRISPSASISIHLSLTVLLIALLAKIF